MKAFITGGAGFIGSHIAQRLAGEGHGVVVFDNLSSGKLENLAPFRESVQFVEGDIRDHDAVERAMQGCDTVFHQAALVSVPYSVDHPQETHDVNLQGTLNVLEAARAAKAKRLVFASSAAIYGDDPELPKNEDMLPSPISPYGIEKLSGEYYLSVWARLFGLETVALRYFNVFGPRQDPSSPYSGVISIFVDRYLKGQVPKIFGDGEHCRDFVYVGNVVDANVRAATTRGVSGRVYNVGCGKRTTLNALAKELMRLTGATTSPEHAPERAGDIRESVASIERARKELGYDPQVDVAEGLSRLVASLR